MRAVLDTNILVSATLNDGNCRKLLLHAAHGRVQLLLSPATTQEYLSVLARPKFGLAKGQAELILAQDILPFAEVVQIEAKELPHPCRDPKDDKFLQCAWQGRARFLITGDEDLHALKGKYSFEIVTAIGALKRLD